MKTYHCLIVEDSEPSILFIKSYLQKIPFLNTTTVCRSCTEAMEVLHSRKIDIIFLDIQLPDYSGLDLLRSSIKAPPTIIVSSHSEFAIESYQIGKAVDYLQKPFEFERFLLAVNRALSIIQNEYDDSGYVLLKKGRLLRRFSVNEILYIESYGMYSKVYTINNMEVVNETMISLEETLSGSNFTRVHKSYIINLDKITELSAKYFKIDNRINIPIGRHYKPKFDTLLRLLDKNDE